MLRNLRTIRLARRITQLELAQRTDLDQTYLSALERGLAPSDPKRDARRIARVLGVTPRLLLSELGVVVGPDGSVREVVVTQEDMRT